MTVKYKYDIITSLGVRKLLKNTLNIYSCADCEFLKRTVGTGEYDIFNYDGQDQDFICQKTDEIIRISARPYARPEIPKSCPFWEEEREL